MTEPIEPLTVDRVRRRADPDAFAFDSTAELEPLEQVVGQDRAAEALRFALSTRRKGYNVFVLGPPGMGKHGLVKRLVGARAKTAPVPDDQVYVFRFDDPDRPRAMFLPPGRGASLHRAMDAFADDLADVLRAAFETDEFRNRRREIEQRVEARNEEAFSALAEVAEEQGLKLMRTPGGLVVAPVIDGKVVGPEQFAELPEAEQKVYRERLSATEDKLHDIMREVPGWQREAREALRALEAETARATVTAELAPIVTAFADIDEVASWLEQVEADIAAHAALIVHEPEGEPDTAIEKALARGVVSPLARYRVNLLVDRTDQEGAPVVHEDHPTLPRLVGKIEQRAHLGALVSDFTLVKKGALHEANGGTLVLDARRVLSTPGAYDALERALRRKSIEIESHGHALGIGARSLEPDPIPLDVKVVLIGERRLYYTLRQLDPEFDQLFKVMADFEDDVPWDDEHANEYARLLGTVARDEALLDLDVSAVARLLELGARLASDARRLSSDLVTMCDTLREADWQARDRGAARIEARDVRGAIDARRRREGRIGERVLDRFEDGTIRVQTEGEVIGQVNGLSVMQVGRAKIGQPNRITARVRLGRGEVVDIERETELGGPLHSKGVLILSGYIGATHAPEGTLNVRASLVFEQSYGGVDGDSASMAELCCLLSAIGRVPIRQRYAITGSVDQRGQVQAIGGVNEKVEGFYDVCVATGLSGEQGVLIPRANVPNLMLREDVVEAIRQRRFHVYAIDDVDQALALLTGVEAGRSDELEGYPPDSVHGRVQARLEMYADRAKEAYAWRVEPR